MREMTNTTNNTTTDDNDKYFLQEQELWENLGFDWEGWNATVGKILQHKSAAKPVEQEQACERESGGSLPMAGRLP